MYKFTCQNRYVHSNTILLLSGGSLSNFIYKGSTKTELLYLKRLKQNIVNSSSMMGSNCRNCMQRSTEITFYIYIGASRWWQLPIPTWLPGICGVVHWCLMGCFDCLVNWFSVNYHSQRFNLQHCITFKGQNVISAQTS